MLRRELLEVARERQEINWQRVGAAVSFYKRMGYTYIEVPWTVAPEATDITWPGEVLSCQAGDLAGSAEQSFLDLELSGKMPQGDKFVAVSPCFRLEPRYDELHHISFVKVELYARGNIFQQLLSDARAFLATNLQVPTEIERQAEGPYVVQDDLLAVIGRDAIEIGSYGYRECNGLKWSYGTGLAEPRSSAIVRMLEQI